MDMSYTGSLSKTDALALRYGEDSIPAAGPWNDAITLMLPHAAILYHDTYGDPDERKLRAAHDAKIVAFA